MKSQSFRGGWKIAALVAFFLFLAPAAPQVSPVSAGHGGLHNPGFEAGTLDGSPKDWVVAASADRARVVDCETATEFGTYADQGIAQVCPYKGNLMLALGTPKRIRQSQTRGANTVTQTFEANSPALSFAFRVFSWEARGDDFLRFSLRQGSNPVGKLAEAVTLPTAEGSPTCLKGSQASCQLRIDAGKQGDFLNSGWIVVRIEDVPVGPSLTLTYSIETTQNDSHATWAYFDNANTPPVARFEFLPNVAPAPLEGDIVTFRNRSYDPDGDPLTYTWKICKTPTPTCSVTAANFDTASGPVTVAGTTHPTWVFANDGAYDACLRVSDGQETSTICDGDLVPVPVPDALQRVPALVVGNAAPKVSALEVEALAGRDVLLVGRFIDPGWKDTHTANWEVISARDTMLREENDPAFSTGIVTAKIAGSSGQQGTLNVRDGAASGSARFDVTVVDFNPQRHEPNDAFGGQAPLPELRSGKAHLSFIQRAGDTDIFKVTHNGGNLPVGGQLLVTLRGLVDQLPADFDLVILAKPPGGVAATSFLDSSFLDSSFLDSSFLDSSFLDSSFLDSSFLDSSFLDSSFLDSSFLDSSFLDSSFLDSSFLDSSFLDSSFLDSSFTFAHFALTDLGFAVPETNLGGADIGPEELGLGGIGAQGLRIAGYSANRGRAPEVAWTASAFDGTEFYVVVLGANGAFSASEPYVLQVETSVPRDPNLFAGANTSCTLASALVSPAALGRTLVNHADPTTLFVTQRERLRALYGLDDAAWAELERDLEALAGHSKVQGKIISLPSDIYDSWDTNPCSVTEANRVTEAIRGPTTGAAPGTVLGELAANRNIKYVVFIGGDRVVPFHRVPDRTVVGNEKLYTSGSLLKPNSPTYAAIQGSFYLEQEYFADRVPTPFEGRELYVADVAVSRMVETPAQIRAQAQAFLSSGGGLNPASASTGLLVTGYDFFEDGARGMLEPFAGRLTSRPLIGPSWTAANLLCQFLGLGGAGCSVPGMSFINAHFSHYGLLPAAAYPNNPNGSVRTSQVPPGGVGLARLAFSMGCHAGLNIMDGDAFTSASLGFDPNRDWAQALQAAIYIASTGFGYGDSDLILGTERILGILAEKLAAGGMSAGEALREARLQYLRERSVLTDYDEKSVVQLTFYGLPMYDVVVPPAGSATLSAATAPALPLNLTGTLLPQPLMLTIDDVLQPEIQLVQEDVARNGTRIGSYFTANRDYQVTPGRPTQPRYVYPIPRDEVRGPVHGVFLTGGAFTPYANFDPVIGTPSGLRGSPRESQVCIDAFWPSFTATGNFLGGAQTLVITPAQFRCTSGPAGTVTGEERLFTSLSYRLLRSTSGDRTPPDITAVDLRLVDDLTGTVAVTVTARSKDVREVVVVRIDNASGLMTPFGATFDASNPGPYTVNVPGVGATTSLLVQSADADGNVSVNTLKGANAKAIRVDAPDVILQPGSLTGTFTATVSGFATLKGPVAYTWDFGDGNGASGTITVPNGVTVPLDGTLTFSVQHTYSSSLPSPLAATVKITDTDGGVGTDDVNVWFACDRAGDQTNETADLVSCGATNAPTWPLTPATMSITIGVAGEISAANPLDVQYRVYLDTGTFDPETKKLISKTPDGVPDFNLRYDAKQDKFTGLPSLVVTKVRDDSGRVVGLTFTFNLLDIGRTRPDHVRWYAETQAGVPRTSEEGKPDRMPDSGFFDYVIR